MSLDLSNAMEIERIIVVPYYKIPNQTDFLSENDTLDNLNFPILQVIKYVVIHSDSNGDLQIDEIEVTGNDHEQWE